MILIKYKVIVPHREIILAELVGVGDALLDPEEERGVELLEPGDRVVGLHLLRPGVQVLLLQVTHQRLFGQIRKKEVVREKRIGKR